MKTNKNVIEECLSRIECLQEHQKAIDAAIYRISLRRPHVKIDCGNLYHELYQEELHEWRSLFMWALTLSVEEQERIKAAAYQNFLSDGKQVSHYFTGNGTSSWLTSTEEEFREMARKAFMPKGLKDG